METRKRLQSELAEYKQNKLKFVEKTNTYKRAERLFSRTHKKHLKVYTDVLAIMGAAEHTVIKEFKLENVYMSYRSSYEPYGYWYNMDIKSVSYKDDGILIKYNRTEDLREGDYKRRFYKTFIPYKYFELDENTLREEHLKWSRIKLQGLIDRKIEITEKKQFDEAYNTYQTLKKKFEK